MDAVAGQRLARIEAIQSERDAWRAEVERLQIGPGGGHEACPGVPYLAMTASQLARPPWRVGSLTP